MLRHITLDPATVAALERHETEAHALTGREIRDLGDGLLLIDPADPEPFWNRLVRLRWPAEAAAFDRRLDEVVTLFASYDRRPHVWPTVTGDTPPDLIARLLAYGFVDTGAGHILALDRPELAPAVRRDELAQDVRLTFLHQPTPDGVSGIARALVEAFGDPLSGPGSSLEAAAADVARAALDPRVTYVLGTVDDEPAAASKVTVSDGFAYLSSIGTRERFRGRGLGALVTRAAAAHGLATGARLVYLGVFEGNETAVRLYARLGFAAVGRAAPDLLLAR